MVYSARNHAAALTIEATTLILLRYAHLPSLVTRRFPRPRLTPELADRLITMPFVALAIAPAAVVRVHPTLTASHVSIVRTALLLLLGGGLDGPVKDIVVLEAFADKQVAEELAEVRVVGLVVEAERTAVVEIDCELVGEAAAEDFGGGRHLCQCQLSESESG